MELTKKDILIDEAIKEFSNKSYKDSNTDVITMNSGISKGMLFHLFKSKKNLYLECLRISLDRLLQNADRDYDGDFYEILFGSMQSKIDCCRLYPLEMRFVNIAVSDITKEIADDKNKIIGEYMLKVKVYSQQTMKKALSSLNIQNKSDTKILFALTSYTNVLINYYLTIYKNNPELFIENSDNIKIELKEYIDYFLYGIVKE